MSDKIFGRWGGSVGSVLSDFYEQRYDWDLEPGKEVVNEDLRGPVPTDDELLFASYGGGAYEGDAIVIFEKEGDLYEVSGSHCSCNGLEGQWSPSKTTWPALALRVAQMVEDLADSDYYYGFLSDHETEARDAFIKLVQAHAPPKIGSL